MYGKSSRKPLAGRTRFLTSSITPTWPSNSSETSAFGLDDTQWHLILKEDPSSSSTSTKDTSIQSKRNKATSSDKKPTRSTNTKRNVKAEQHNATTHVTSTRSTQKRISTHDEERDDLTLTYQSKSSYRDDHISSERDVSSSPMKKQNTGRGRQVRAMTPSDETVSEGSLTPLPEMQETPLPDVDTIMSMDSNEAPIPSTPLKQAILEKKKEDPWETLADISPKRRVKGGRVARMKAAAAAPAAEMTKKKIPITRTVSNDLQKIEVERDQEVARIGALSLDSPRKNKNPLDTNVPPVIAPMQRSNSAKITYGERRTILAHASTTSSDAHPLGAVPEQPGALSIDDILAGAGGEENSCVIDEGLSSDDEQDTGPAVKSSHILRAAGEAKRFKDELEYLIDGLSPTQPIKVRCSTCLSLCQKAKTDNFVQFLDAHNHICRLLNLLYDAEDMFLRSMFLFLISVWVDVNRNFESIANLDDFMNATILDLSWTVDQDPLRHLPSKKSEQRQIKQLMSIIEKAYPEYPELSMADLSLKATTCMFRILPHGITSAHAEMLSNSFSLSHAVNSLIESASDCHELGFLDFDRLSFLDLVLSNYDIRNIVLQKHPDLTKKLMERGRQFKNICFGDDLHNLAAQCLILVLRILVNIAHDNPKNVSDESCIEWISNLWALIWQAKKNLKRNAQDSDSENADDDESWKRLFDLTLLTVTLLVNLIEQRQEHTVSAKKNVSDVHSTRILINCEKKKQCQKTCKCEQSTFSHHLRYTFHELYHIPNEEKSVEEHVLMGYMGVLIGSLYKNTASTSLREALISSTHPSKSKQTGAVGMESLVQVLESFSAFYEIVGKHEGSESVVPGGVYESQASILGLIDHLKAASL